VGSTFGFYVKTRISHAPSAPAPFLRLGSDHLTSLTHPVASVRQDLAGLSPAAALIARKAATSSFDPANLHILVVEDNLINQKVLVKQLKKHGCVIGVANDGIEALEFLVQTKYVNPQEGRDLSIILMDLEMPRMGGLECVRKIRVMEKAGEIHGHIPVVAVTANVREEQVRVARESGMDDVIPKPFTIRELFEKVEALLHQR
jgi:CheY-like chemotaxis protein